MRKFLVRSFLFGIGLAVSIALFVSFCVLSHWSEVVASQHLEPWQYILFIGDSHIGCTFVENREYENRIVWEPSMPQQFTLMRLLDMERDGGFGNVETVVLDIGLQSLGQQRTERMKEFWWRMLPISWRHQSLLPLGVWDRFEYAIGHLAGRMSVMSPMPTNNVSIVTRTKEERAREFAETSKCHFAWTGTPEQMCEDWELSLHESIDGIIRVCRRNDLRLVFFTAPLTSYYRASIPAIAESKFQKFVSQIRDSGIEYHDLRKWGEDRYFCDSFHFTHDGARRFTRWFYSEILKTPTVRCASRQN